MAHSPDGGIRILPRKKEKSKEKEQFKDPEDYRVIILNDDFTTMEFVVEILMLVFHKSQDDAIRLMMDIHRRGSGTAGVYPWDIAQTKALQVHEKARERDFPLRCLVEAV